MKMKKQKLNHPMMKSMLKIPMFQLLTRNEKRRNVERKGNQVVVNERGISLMMKMEMNKMVMWMIWIKRKERRKGWKKNERRKRKEKRSRRRNLVSF